ncbi:MAG: hypothetical protein M3P93_15520 [Actinomycetota bacterium]|nr:hypothetical protein [Actinomycetota bacterium]
MGAFYDSLAAWAPRDAVVETVGKAYAAALVGPTRAGWTLVAPDSDGRLDDALSEAALALSAHGPVVCTTVHDDDDLLLQVYDAGRLVATYDSCPGYLGEGPTEPDLSEVDALAAALGIADVAPLRRVLAGRYDTETERLAAVAPLLGLPSYVVLFGYDYAVDGDLPPGLAQEDLQAVGSP